MAFNLADQLSRKKFCLTADIQGFTPEELSQLHVFKHELLGSLYRLYTKVPPEKADRILAKNLGSLQHRGD